MRRKTLIIFSALAPASRLRDTLLGIIVEEKLWKIPVRFLRPAIQFFIIRNAVFQPFLV